MKPKKIGENENNKKIDQSFKNKIGKKKYFLMCGNCFWMTSTLYILPNKNKPNYSACPICAYRIHNYFVI
jgi:hypothetical protein